ncbi:MAG TPA: CoA ester lyase [Xanthobacteraceae bacterium]|jgi:citrate lyase subunit beta/citryl-CoA lyase|nr:CoA ester lyase [Xanthobacteraceae bacterium]
MQQTIRPRRSALYMPGSNARALEKARTLPADVIIIDLEDAVAPEAKPTARQQACAAIKAKGFGSREVVLRVNGLDTPWAADDLSAAIVAGPDAVLIPKVASPEQLQAVGNKISRAPRALAVWAMIETAQAILNIAAVAASAKDASTRLTTLVLGTNDIAKETRARFVPGRLPWLTALSQVILAGRAQGLDVLDGVFNDIKDIEGFKRECEDGRDLGFDGKTLVHPTQVEPCNGIFSPSDEEVAAAQRIVDAFALPENKGKGVISLDGRMVEIMHADIAARTVALSKAIRAKA